MARYKLTGQGRYALRLGAIWAGITLIGQVVASAITGQPIQGSTVLESALVISGFTVLLFGIIMPGQGVDQMSWKIKLPFGVIGTVAWSLLPVLAGRGGLFGEDWFLLADFGFMIGWYTAGVVASAIAGQREAKRQPISQS